MAVDGDEFEDAGVADPVEQGSWASLAGVGEQARADRMDGVGAYSPAAHGAERGRHVPRIEAKDDLEEKDVEGDEAQAEGPEEIGKIIDRGEHHNKASEA